MAKSRFRDLIVRINEEREHAILLTSHGGSDIEQVARRDRDQPRTADRRRPRVGDAPRMLDQMLDVRFGSRKEASRWRARVVKLSGASELVIDTAQRPIRSVLDDLLDRYDVVDISVADPPLRRSSPHLCGPV